MEGIEDGGGRRGNGGDAVGPAEAAEVGDEVADPVEAMTEGGGKGLPGVFGARGGSFGWRCGAPIVYLRV